MTDLTWESIQPLLLNYGASVGMALLHIVLILVAGWVAIRFLRKALEKLTDILTRVGKDEEAGVPSALRSAHSAFGVGR